MKLNNLTVDTVVVGAGQAGVAMSEHLNALGISHVVLEKNRIAEAWRTRRWDSLVANGPCWHDRFPNMEFDADPDSFIHHDQVADYFQNYAEKFNLPIHTGVEVFKVYKTDQRLGFTVETSEGTIYTQRLVSATGAFQKAVIPPVALQKPEFYQIHSDQYKNPQQLPEGAVLVIGSGSSGVQIADEINRSGKKVYLSIGQHERPPRTYRNRDNVWWLGVLGGWDFMRTDKGPLKGLAVSGAHGGINIDFRALAKQGITLLGMTDSFDGQKIQFKADLKQNLESGDAALHAFYDQADEYVRANGLDLPAEPQARQLLPNPECVTQPILELDMQAANITSVIWASGFSYDFDWLQVNAFDEQKKPKHKRGISDERGIYFLGLPYLTGRGSSFIWGVWHDAKYIAEHIDIQRKYQEYQTDKNLLKNTA
ncbi:NAD(P)/FAD-dependent oxidoreductase [Acinetobacter sp. ANC 5579]|uniref:flavin-containing monooxygenase n=1 Tax=Acinetobacter amyesii TaxID=2942470 RepID=UPI00201B42CD|nr:NAD(P)/FAD-dependent oxidoreductase [Acinetobacter amyesii]MCL6233093.1 NAD(P)/FAD-dependent oxidoreductase [Acinetobacter amyesii]MCL6234747.1 NAD(P)/FAD-dependent oxidoreductase [Acinetobacter amyesii]